MSKRGNSPGYRAGWCIHYRSSHGGETFTDCEAGVPFDRWNGTKFDARPCFLDKDGQSKPGAALCERLRRPSAEEIAADKEAKKASMDRLFMVMRAIMPWREAHQDQGFVETVECPACKGRLRLSIARYNNHVHGHCATEGCVSWME